MQFIQITRPIVLNLTVERAILLRDKSLLDVMAIPGDMQYLIAAVSDPYLFSQILWECTDQTGLTFEVFSGFLKPENLEELAEAFTREVIAFFPPLIRDVMNKSLSGNERSKPSENDDESHNYPTTDGGHSGKWPGSSDSTLDPSRFDTSQICAGANSAPTGFTQQT
jgi:hypothetical protein